MNRLFYPSYVMRTLIGAALAGALTIGVILGVAWMWHSENKKEIGRHAWDYWSMYFTQTNITQDWKQESAQQKLAADAAAYSEHLRVVLWDASHQVVFKTPVRPEGEGGQVFSRDGQVVGAFNVTMNVPFEMNMFQWFFLWLGGGLVAFLYAQQGLLVGERYRRERKAVVRQLCNMMGEEDGDEDVGLLLERLKERLHELEKGGDAEV